MRVLDSVLQAIGNTPLVRLRRMPEPGSAEILVKLESLNPGGSVKARSALRMIEEAEREGALRPDSVIVEASSGNQGIALAMIGAVKGYRVIVCMPETMSAERRKVLEAYGAETVLTPRGRDMKETLEICISRARALAAANPRAFLARQFGNEANPRAHADTTAKEILAATGGKLDAFVAGIGTGGTISGTGRALKAVAPSVKIIAVEPENASLLRPCRMGHHVQEGIGDGVFPSILDTSVIDDSILVSDADAVATARTLAREEGIFCGISSGSTVFGALQVGRLLGPGRRVVTVIADGGEKYLSTALFGG